MSCFGTVILELRCLGYCISACFSLLFIYIINIGSRPWKPKDRPNEPECLSDPKYGVHKFASVNVNPTNWIKNPELLRLRMWCATTVKNAALGGTLGAGCWALCSMVRKCFFSPHSWKKKLCENHLKILERMSVTSLFIVPGDSYALCGSWWSKQAVDIICAWISRVLVLLAPSNHWIFQRFLVCTTFLWPLFSTEMIRM